MQVVVTNDFSYKGKEYKKGDTVDMTKKHIDRYAKLNYVEAPVEPESEPQTKDKAKGPVKLPNTK
jgi:hypothetical protein